MMKVLTGEQVSERLDNIVHFDTQGHAFEVDLTAAEVYRLTGAGSLDFGGSEFEEAPRERLEPKLADPDDKYGWWELDAGAYVVRYNENVDPGETGIAYVQPHERILMAGAHHPAFHFRGRREHMETLFLVGSNGCKLKENCRVSKLLIFEVN